MCRRVCLLLSLVILAVAARESHAGDPFTEREAPREPRSFGYGESFQQIKPASKVRVESSPAERDRAADRATAHEPSPKARPAAAVREVASKSDANSSVGAAAYPGGGAGAPQPRKVSAAERAGALPLPAPLTPADGPPHARSTSPSITGILGSLAVVLGLLFLATWILKRLMPRGSAALPPEVLEILGRAPLAARQQMQLVRCGRKLILLNVSPNGAEALTEIDDPEEVERLTLLCQQRSGPVYGTGSLPSSRLSKWFQQAPPRKIASLADEGQDLGATAAFSGLAGRAVARERTNG